MFWTLDTGCYAGLAHVALELAARSSSASDESERRSRARSACRALQAFARVMPIAKPRALLMRGRYCSQVGSRSKALTLWRKSLEAAEQLRMPYEQGLAHFELSACAGNSEPERRKHFEAAQALFTKCNAVCPRTNNR